MSIHPALAISPLDGRYIDRVRPLSEMVSEYGLIKYRILVEVKWLIRLADDENFTEIPTLSDQSKQVLLDLVNNFSADNALEVKAIERRTNHDVKAVEYWIKEKIAGNAELEACSEFIHFACTSEDINNLSYGLMFKEVINDIFVPEMEEMLKNMRKMAHQYAAVPMLSRTHGQAATPTTLGKEIANVIFRIERQVGAMKKLEFLGKINGAVGNYNTHLVAYPNVDWPAFAEGFIEEDLGLTFAPYSTQIECHDYIAEFSHLFERINTILIDWSRDVWTYISLDYFTQKTVADEVGSSTMPHKVNPIDFENAEGNFGIANALFNHFASKLPISRMQRDLSDSTVLRSVGSAFGYTLIGLSSLNRGHSKLEVNEQKLLDALNANVEVLGEPIQTVMRREGLEQPYERLKAFTRGKRVSKAELDQFVDTLELDDETKTRLKALTPDNYIGLAEKLAKEI